MIKTRNNVMYLALGLLLLSCKNSETPSLAEMGYQPNDLDELKKSPEYVDLSKYEIEESEETYVPKKSPKESDLEDAIHIKYDQPINGYNVSADLFPDGDGFYGPADIHFSKENTSFSVHVDNFDDIHFDRETVLHGGETITLKYTPLPKGKMISPDCTFFFSDVDFDGTKELLVREPLYWTTRV